MIKVYKIEVPAHEWGRSWQREVAVGKEVEWLTGAEVVVRPRVGSVRSGAVDAGVVSLSVCGGDVVCGSLPALVAGASYGVTLRKRMSPIDFQQAGSRMRVVMEEREECPFADGDGSYDVTVYLNYRR